MCNVSWVNPSLRCSVRAHLLRVGCQFLAQCIKNTPEHLFPAKSSRLAVGTMLSVDCSWCLLLCLLFISMCKYVWCGFLVEDFRRGALIMVCSPFFLQTAAFGLRLLCLRNICAWRDLCGRLHAPLATDILILLPVSTLSISQNMFDAVLEKCGCYSGVNVCNALVAL